jgi:hypothetical protein
MSVGNGDNAALRADVAVGVLHRHRRGRRAVGGDRLQARCVHPREPGSSLLQHIEHTPQRLSIESAVDADAVPATDMNLDLTHL